MPPETSSSRFWLGALFAISIESGAHSQAGLLEYQACVTAGTPVNMRIFSCSKVIADRSQPPAILRDALLNRAEAYEQDSKSPEVVADTSEVLRQDPQNRKALELRARNADYEGASQGKQGAVADYSVLIKMDPQNYKYLNGRAYAYRTLDKKRAIEDYTEALKYAPLNQHRNILMNRGQTYFTLGMKPDAVADYKRTLGLPTDNDSDPENVDKYTRETIVKWGGTL